jgi:hypothetical protein
VLETPRNSLVIVEIDADGFGELGRFAEHAQTVLEW